MELALDTSVQYIPRVGPTMASRLERLGIRTVRDLLFYPPFRYNDYSLVSPIAQVQPGETVTVAGVVRSHVNLMTKKGKKMQKATVADDSGSIDVVWFNQPFLARTLAPGVTVHLAGPAGWFNRRVCLMSPEYELLSRDSNGSLHTGRLVPVYPETEGVSSKWLRGRIAYILGLGLADIPDHLPEDVRGDHSLIGLSEALKAVHFPGSQQSASRARRRLAFDELYVMQITAYERRRLWETRTKARRIPTGQDVRDTFVRHVPFTLTGDQQTAIAEIYTDLAKPVPMNRLLIGDVGSGKTVVAAAAMYACFKNGMTSLLMAPTQILAEQHYKTLERLFSPLGIEVQLVTSKHKPAETRTVGMPPVWVGTHALLSESVNVSDVGLVIIDEQQRFGVAQRQLLREKEDNAATPHLLTMTATPIPRTIALTLFGNLDISTITQMPEGRKPVKTWVVNPDKRDAAYDWIRSQIRTDHAQAFIVCPLIETSESLGSVRAATEEFKRVSGEVFPELRLGLLHGRMSAREKTAVLAAFRSGATDLLVATPVVEVGIDIPNARIMLIEASERFGLAQLHQLRGRVGRGSRESYCLLFTDAGGDERVMTRLKALETIHNGPMLAETDLKLRGPGELFGTRQHGLPDLKFGTFLDMELLRTTNAAARHTFEKDPALSSHPLLRQKMEEGIIDDIPQD